MEEEKHHPWHTRNYLRLLLAAGGGGAGMDTVKEVIFPYTAFDLDLR